MLKVIMSLIVLVLVIELFIIACKRTPSPKVYVVTAGTEHVEFTNLFPIWNERNDVQGIVGKVSN